MEVSTLNNTHPVPRQFFWEDPNPYYDPYYAHYRHRRYFRHNPFEGCLSSLMFLAMLAVLVGMLFAGSTGGNGGSGSQALDPGSDIAPTAHFQTHSQIESTPNIAPENQSIQLNFCDLKSGGIEHFNGRTIQIEAYIISVESQDMEFSNMILAGTQGDCGKVTASYSKLERSEEPVPGTVVKIEGKLRYGGGGHTLLVDAAWE
ncbi:MAG: hypothetical protein R2792_17240 [Saprospiraceae bacterium]